jgi:hypothetical protein
MVRALRARVNAGWREAREEAIANIMLNRTTLIANDCDNDFYILF